jgi:23S rRNA-/tRNA-specific pseudouridylate synthase
VGERVQVEEAVVGEAGLRVDRWATEHLQHLPSRASARKAAKRGDLRLNGEPVESSRFVAPGDVVTLWADDEVPPTNRLMPQVCFADEHMAVVIKPPGVLTNGARHRTLERGLPNVLPRSRATGSLAAARPVHRLDFETTGLVVVARTEQALVELSRAFQERRVHKTYRALVAGRLEQGGRIEEPLDGREAISEVEVLGHTRSLKIGWSTSVRLHPVTGRMHQLRRHLSGIGHAVLGDRRYPSGPVLRKHGLFLASVAVQLPHPVHGEPISVRTELPAKFGVFLAREDRRWRAHHGEEGGE